MIKENYRSDIDGLRAVAVLSVLLFHLGFTKFSGGFIGVDVFFVISGFLITRLIKEEIDRTGSFNFKNFYLRRIRRLFPALFVCLFITMVFAAMLLSPGHLQRFGGALTSSLASVSNFYFWHEADYFDMSAKVKPLLHTWSLSIEEQFYLIWPVMVFLFYKPKRKWTVCLIFFIASCLSLFLNENFSDGSVGVISRNSTMLASLISNGKSTIYFLMPFRVFEFSIGSLVVWLVNHRFKIRFIHDFLFILGTGLIFYSVVTFNDSMLFPSYAALVPCIGAAFLIYSGASSWFSPLLTSKLSVSIGLISYSLYLVHWPVIVFWSYVRSDVTLFDQVSMAVISFVLAYLSYRFIECPFRYKRFDYNQIACKSLGIVAILLVGSLGIHMEQTGGWSWRISSPVFFERIVDTSQFEKDFYGGAGYPAYGPVKSEKPADIVLIGDSHGRHYAEGIYKEWAEPEGKNLFIAAGSSFMHLPDFTRTTAGVDWNKLSSEKMNIVFSAINNATKPPIVIMSHSWVSQMRLADLLDEQGTRRHIKVDTEDVIQGIRALKKRIGDCTLVVIGQVPTSGDLKLYDVFTRPRLPFFSEFDPVIYLKSPVKEGYAQFNNRLSEVAHSTGEFIFLDPLEALCDNGICRNTDNQNRLIYSDNTHLSKYGSREVIRAFLPQLKKISQDQFAAATNLKANEEATISN